MTRTVLVTGGGTGFGYAIAARFAQEGDLVYITGRRREVLDEACAGLGERAHALPCDVTIPEELERAASSVEGKVDVLVNNAGGNTDFGMPAGGGLRATLDGWRANLDANVLGAVLTTEALDSRLAEGGALVHIGSIAADKGNGSYGAAKAALASWNAGVAQQLGRRDITSNVVAPGYFPGTEFFGDGLPHELHEKLIADAALGRAGETGEVAETVKFLASSGARYITGQVIHVNGGARTTR